MRGSSRAVLGIRSFLRRYTLTLNVKVQSKGCEGGYWIAHSMKFFSTSTMTGELIWRQFLRQECKLRRISQSFKVLRSTKQLRRPLKEFLQIGLIDPLSGSLVRLYHKYSNWLL